MWQIHSNMEEAHDMGQWGKGEDTFCSLEGGLLVGELACRWAYEARLLVKGKQSILVE